MEDILEKKLGKILTEKDLTIACAESCTGGLLTSRLTDVAGSSIYVQGSIVSYSNDIKNSVLKVKSATLRRFGAVSEQTAREMSNNVRKLFVTDIGVGVTGIAGPDGGTVDKPVGTVYISVSNLEATVVKRFHFSGSRIEIKNQACDAAMEMVIELVTGK